MWETFIGLLPVLMSYVPVDYISMGTSVIGGAAMVAAGFARPNSQISRKLHTFINVIGFNFGKARNK